MKIALALATVLATACGTNEATSSQGLTREAGACGELETHVIGVLAPDVTNSAENPSVVTVRRPGRHVIVLAGVESVHWEVRAEGGAEIEQVYTFGGDTQLVTAPAGTAVIASTEADGSAFACGYAWPPTIDCDTAVLLRLTSLLTKLHPNTFNGCRSASAWTIGEDLAVTSDCPAATELQAPGTAQTSLVTLCLPDDGDPTNDCDEVIYYEP